MPASDLNQQDIIAQNATRVVQFLMTLRCVAQSENWQMLMMKGVRLSMKGKVGSYER
jgi:hypothetical protein